MQLVVHLTAEALTKERVTGSTVLGRLDRSGPQLILEQQVRDWCGRHDTAVSITPMIDLSSEIAVAQYEVPDRIKVQVAHRDLTCVFPHCTRPATSSDCDHIEPFEDDESGGKTRTSNIAALCRRHHRLKTHGGWRYQRIGPRSYPWTNQYGHQYLRDNEGTVGIKDNTTKPRLPRAG